MVKKFITAQSLEQNRAREKFIFLVDADFSIVRLPNPSGAFIVQNRLNARVLEQIGRRGDPRRRYRAFLRGEPEGLPGPFRSPDPRKKFVSGLYNHPGDLRDDYQCSPL